MTVAVLAGGTSLEREISLMSGKAISDALRRKGHEVLYLDFVGNNFADLLQNKIDVVFIALHGRGGEDGTVQGVLELLRIPYTGSGVLSSALCMDKIMSKKTLEKEGIPTPSYRVIKLREVQDNTYRHLSDVLNLPLVLKTPQGGSAMGVFKVKNEEEFFAAVCKLRDFDEEALVEENIEGQELTVGILGNESVQVFPPVEIVSCTPAGFYDYEAKYKLGASQHIIPARITPDEDEKVRNISVKVHTLLRCRGMSRIDIMLKNNIPYVLEVNTIPGFTETSLFPEAARYVGISFDDLVEKITKFALN